MASLVADLWTSCDDSLLSLYCTFAVACLCLGEPIGSPIEFVFRHIFHIFFFSSRRRHTRYWRDWSSDVCSSDLGDPGSIDFLKEEARVLGQEIGLWFEYFFYIAAFAVLLSTNVGIVDYVSRLTADSLKTGYLARSEFWSESKLYFVAAWIMCIGGAAIIWSGIEPLWLLVIASSGGGVVMFLYSGMLIWLNRRILPEPIKIKGARLVVISITFAVFAVLRSEEHTSELQSR